MGMYCFDEFGWFCGAAVGGDRTTDLAPPTLSVSDQVGGDRANWTGLEWIVRPYQASPAVVPAVIVPAVVGPGQMMVALEGLGLLDEAETWVAQQPRYVQLAWARVSEFRRDSVLINDGAAALGWDAELVDSVFVTAGQVAI